VTLTVNHAVAALLRGRPAKPDERIVVVHNFADPAEFGPLRLTDGQIGSTLRLVYHGTLTPLYGLDLAIEAVARAREAGSAVELDIFGDGPSVGDLRDLIRRRGLGDWVRLRGTAPHHALRQLLSSYDAGLVPTRLDGMTRFSLSTKLLEYIHLGLPIIIPALPTYREYFPEDTAWYFTPNSADDAARAIATLVRATPEERIRRAGAAQSASAARLDPASDAALLRELYLELLENHR
jgi:glycosyltransferase involved in cell wall biosynthesis